MASAISSCLRKLERALQRGDATVEKVRYTEGARAPLPASIGQGGQGCPRSEETENLAGRVWINKTQYFEGVPPDVWKFHIGGYQVCHKWLKDRKGRKLTYDDITHYQRIVSALSETIRLMTGIDEAIDRHGGWPIR